MIPVVIDALIRTISEKLEKYLRIIAIPDYIPYCQAEFPKKVPIQKVTFNTYNSNNSGSSSIH